MIHSMVVAIDSTESSKQAQEFALTLATKYNAKLTGIAVLDLPWIKRPMMMPIGGGAYRAHRDETLIANQTKELEEKLQAFDQLCTARGVPCRGIEVEGSPNEQLDREAEQHDLVVIGRETNFHGHRGHDIGEATDKLLKDHPRPVIIVPPAPFQPGNGAVICFDGSLPASRAMHMFYLLGLAKDEPVHVVSVSEDAETAEKTALRGANFFSSRGINATAHGIHAEEDSGEIALTIFNMVESLGAGIVSMGAYAEHGLLRQLLVGSVTRQMARSCPVPLFVAY